jgi:purine-nucleoside phosphorylase
LKTKNRRREIAAVQAAQCLRRQLRIEETPRCAIVLGTGWGDVLNVTNAREVELESIDGFSDLYDLEKVKGHARRVVYGKLGDQPVIVLRGRLHLNEAPADKNLLKMVRLQIEMLLQLEIKVLILTAAVGSLDSKNCRVGDVVVIDGFVTLYAPEMPLWGGEFYSPEDTLDPQLREIAKAAWGESSENHAVAAGHVMVRGPFFEGRKYDKALLAESGASVVGMSILPEACVAALYDNVKVLGLTFVTNDDVEVHEHELIQRRAKESAAQLGAYLERIVTRIPA